MTWSEKVVLHISPSILSAWTHLSYLHCCSLSYSKVMAEKLLVTFMTWNDLGIMRREVTGLNFLIQDVNFSCNPIVRVFRMVFVQKRRLSIFSHRLIKERSQYRPGLGSPILKFWDIHFTDSLARINHGKFQGNRSIGEAMTSIQTFLWGEVTWRDLVTWPCVTWVWNFHNICGNDVWMHLCDIYICMWQQLRWLICENNCQIFCCWCCSSIIYCCKFTVVRVYIQKRI